jgi:hypothetical protein
MSQVIKLKRGSLENLSTITSSLQQGEILIATGSSNITASNGSAILYYAYASGAIAPANRVLQGTNAPNIFSGSIYNGLLNGVPYYASASSTLYLLNSDGNQAINLVGNIQPFSSSVSASIATLSASLAANTGIFTPTGSAYATINNIQISGSLSVSSSITASNINVGAPGANAWQTSLNGSYFNNFTSASNVSDILRFVAGLLSASAPDASPNTRTLGSVTANLANSTTGTALTGRIPQSSTNTTITYLNTKGFASASSTIFSGIGTIYNSNTLGYNYTSVATGTTVATSSADAQLFGVGRLSAGTPTSFTVSSSFTFRYFDNAAKTQTATSASVLSLTQTGAGTTNGVTLALINTVNPAVIPPGYQDGKFVAVAGQTIYNGGLSVTGASGSGYYHISTSIAIQSGSSAFTTPLATNGSELFYAPLTTIASAITTQTPTTGSTTISALTAVSRSLSGAPYLSGSTYSISSSVSGTFSPLFFNGTDASLTPTGTGIAFTSGINAVATSNGLISTANAVYAADGTTLRATSTIPFETDTIKLNGLYTFGAANITNITQTSLTPTTFTLGANGYNYNGAATTYNNTVNYFTSGTFGQPISSGSLGYYTRTQGTDTATDSGSSNLEPFTGENYRMQVSSSVLTFSAPSWPTTYGVYNLAGIDLQIKPGFLVKPGGANAYWLGDPDTTQTSKYYIRRFTTNGATKTSMTINVGQTLTAWTAATTPSISAVVLFQSSKNPTFTNARLYDPTATTSNFIATQTANTLGYNPFSSAFDLYGNTGGSLATTTYTVPLRNADGMTLDATNTAIYVIIRYNGDPTPITSMTVTFA